jgi:4a-hydroxytetrahydrobiopterin dehydratase
MVEFPDSQLNKQKVIEKCDLNTIDYLHRVNNNWNIDFGEEHKLHREWKLQNFVEALKFVNHIGEIAEKEQHHPDIYITGYRNVKIELWTHANGGLTENDFILASKIDQLSPEEYHPKSKEKSSAM